MVLPGPRQFVPGMDWIPVGESCTAKSNSKAEIDKLQQYAPSSGSLGTSGSGSLPLLSYALAMRCPYRHWLCCYAFATQCAVLTRLCCYQAQDFRLRVEVQPPPLVPGMRDACLRRNRYSGRFNRYSGVIPQTSSGKHAAHCFPAGGPDLAECRLNLDGNSEFYKLHGCNAAVHMRVAAFMPEMLLFMRAMLSCVCIAAVYGFIAAFFGWHTAIYGRSAAIYGCKLTWRGGAGMSPFRFNLQVSDPRP
eukprot:1706889-Rhodomonas_salina.1